MFPRLNLLREVVEVVKFSNSRLMKVLFASVGTSVVCKSVGLSMFVLHLSGNSIDEKQFHQITARFGYFQVESHVTNRCKINFSYVCTLFGSLTSHSCRDFKSNSLMCCNCCSDHNKLSMRSSERREVLKLKKNNISHRLNLS